jgi:hypothetical protein
MMSVVLRREIIRGDFQGFSSARDKKRVKTVLPKGSRLRNYKNVRIGLVRSGIISSVREGRRAEIVGPLSVKVRQGRSAGRLDYPVKKECTMKRRGFQGLKIP